MTSYTLSNGQLRIEADSLGAELRSLTSLKSGRPYLWTGDPAYWSRISPVLFPFVGGLKNKAYTWQGKSFPMTQHGFARDREFILKEQREDMLRFTLWDDEESRKVYPFAFALDISYLLEKNKVTVLWEVQNPGEERLYFSIGGHPAFLCPPGGDGRQTDCYLGFDTKEKLFITPINENGLAERDRYTLPLTDGLLQITEHMFDKDALVIENDQAHRVVLQDREKRPYICVDFDAPLFGIWTPAGKNAPFICIEPWYGRCDAQDFEGDLAAREWMQSLEPGGTFRRSYTITVLE